MSLTPDQAAASLRDVEDAQRRSQASYGYRWAAPFLIFFGPIWMIGYGGDDLVPRYAGDIWLVLTIIGFFGAAFIGRTLGARRNTPARNNEIGLRATATWIVVAGFIIALFSILPPVNSEQVGAFFGLLTGGAYLVLGVWMGLRFIFAGALIAGLTLAGYFFVHPHFGLWMAVVGGGTLLLSGLWLRRA